MKKWFTKTKVVAVIAVIAIILSGMAVTAISGSGKTYKTLLDKVMAEDGFLYGVNYPWMDKGHTFADNPKFGWETNTFDDAHGAEYLYQDFVNLKALGFNAVQMVACGNYMEGVNFDEHGHILSIDEAYTRNLRTWMETAKATGTNLGIILQFHTTRMYSDADKVTWDKYTQYYCNPEVRKEYMDIVMSPLLDVIKDYKDNVLYLCLGDELENEINDLDVDWNWDGGRAVYGVDFDDMYQFYSDLNDLCKEKMPDTPRTIATNADFFNKYEDFGLTFIGRNRYDNDANVRPVEDYKTSMPIVLTEYGLSEKLSDEHYQKMVLRMLGDARDLGYMGVMWWQMNTTPGADNMYTLHDSGFEHRAQVNHLAVRFLFDRLDCEYERDGIDDPFDTPVMLSQSGSGRVCWINSREAETMDLERSYDGGKTWTKILTGVDIAALESPSNAYTGEYVDTAEVGKEVCYRVTQYGDDRSATSAPSMTATVKEPPKDVMKNGGFENGDLTNWFADDGSIKATAEAARTGDYGLLMAGSAWSHCYQDLKLEKNTTYELRCWYKLVPGQENKCVFAYLRTGTYSNHTGNKTLNEGYMKDCVNGEWTPMLIRFNTGNNTNVYLELCLNDPPSSFYIDDIKLTKVE